MKLQVLIAVILFGIVACDKPEPQELPDIPEGADPYTEADIQFVPYNETNEKFELMPAAIEFFHFNFKERKRTESYWAWDQTWFTHSEDAELELELRLRYLQNDVSQKTLAVYMPYRDANGAVQSTLFEMPISNPETIEDGFWTELIDFHDTLVINSTEWYDVYEVFPLTSTSAETDGPDNYTKIFYNKVYGLIELDTKSGERWVLEQ